MNSIEEIPADTRAELENKVFKRTYGRYLAGNRGVFSSSAIPNRSEKAEQNPKKEDGAHLPLVS